MCIRGNQGLIEMLTPEADWGFRLPRLPGLPRLPPAFFMGKMLLIIYNIIKILYIPQFSKKNTRGVTEVTAVTRGLIARNPDQYRTQSGPTHCHVRKKQYLCTRNRHLSRIADTLRRRGLR